MKKIYLLYILPLLAVVAMLTACADDDSFTTSADHQLTFSTDTIRLDTTFSKVPTATKTFWVYNRSGDGIRLTNVRLERGNQTGFRVNVDGVFLGQESGFQVNNLEVRNKDSIRVFVELTSPLNNGDEPQKVEDNLVFTLESGVQQKVNLNAYSWDAELLKSLEIKRDTTIASSGKPIVIQGGLKVDSGAVLTIAEGTTLYFANGAGIDVYGQLQAKGTAQKNVVLRGDRIDRMFDYLPYDRISGQWQGIRFHSSSYGNILAYTDLHSAYNGIVCDSSSIERQKLFLANSTIHNCQGYGLVSTNCTIVASNCQITNTLNDCAAFFGGGVTLIQCTIAQFYPFDAHRGASLRLTNYRGDYTYPLYQFKMFNSLVTGDAENVIVGDFKDDVRADYLFDHCILRTIKPDSIDNNHYVKVWWENPKDTVRSGRKHFRKIDADKQYYDFHLDSVSSCIDSAQVWQVLDFVIDRDGNGRDGKPDIGCYEYQKP